MALLFIPSQAKPGDPTLFPSAFPLLFQSCYPPLTWGKLTIFTGIMDSRSLGEERRDESRGSTYEVLEGLNLTHLTPENMLDGKGRRR